MRKLILAVAGIAAATCLTSPAALAAAFEIEYFYYSDASHTTEVGYRTRYCNGQIYGYGQTTEFVEIWTTPCPF